jgi:L-threonylcarbamoyladenylate synthase
MKARVYTPTTANFRRLASALRRGELVAIPTETVYGLAANALDAKACRSIYTAKRRPSNDPLIVHVLGLDEAEQLAEFNPAARKIAAHFWPGPLTLVLPKKPCVPSIVTSGGPTIAIRAPAHLLARRLLRESGLPLAAPSANLFGYISPTEVAHVIDGLGQRIKYVLDGGSCAIGVESTILDLSEMRCPRILRPGTVTAGQISQILRSSVQSGVEKSRESSHMPAPGMMESHYSPATLLRIRSGTSLPPSDIGIILLRKPTGRSPANVHWLSQTGTLTEAAHNLYRVLRKADRSGYREIWIEPIGTVTNGMATALKDRMERAAAKR